MLFLAILVQMQFMLSTRTSYSVSSIKEFQLLTNAVVSFKFCCFCSNGFTFQFQRLKLQTLPSTYLLCSLLLFLRTYLGLDIFLIFLFSRRLIVYAFQSRHLTSFCLLVRLNLSSLYKKSMHTIYQKFSLTFTYLQWSRRSICHRSALASNF